MKIFKIYSIRLEFHKDNNYKINYNKKIIEYQAEYGQRYN